MGIVYRLFTMLIGCSYAVHNLFIIRWGYRISGEEDLDAANRISGEAVSRR